jgi:hypothetical protein
LAVHFPAEQLVLPSQLPVTHYMLHLTQHILEDKRLQEIILGTEMDRVDSGFDGGMSGHEYDQGLRGNIPYIAQHSHSVRSRHHEIRKHHVEIVLIDYSDRTVSIRSLVNFISFPSQELTETLPGRILIFNDKNGSSQFNSPSFFRNIEKLFSLMNIG